MKKKLLCLFLSVVCALFLGCGRGDDCGNDDDTVNYAEVFQVVKAEMEIASQLLEHVAGRIVNAIFSKFPTVEAVELKLSKRNPPMGADIACAGVELQVERP